MKKTDKPVPVYLKVSNDFRDRIVKGELLPGAMLPSENELCSIYNLSRETIRKSLKHLEQEGLIYSRPRRGYFVEYPRQNQLTLSVDEHLQDENSRFLGIQILTPDADVCRILELSAEDKVIVLLRGFYDESFLYGVEIKYLPYSRGLPSIENEIHFAVLPEAASRKTTSFEYYTKVRLSATLPTPQIRELLGCAENEPLMLLSKLQTTQGGEKISYSRQYLYSRYGELNGFIGYRQSNPKNQGD